MATWVTPVKLTEEQQYILIATLNDCKRTPKLKEKAVQNLILKRIEGVMTYLGTQTEKPETNEPFDRVSDFSRSIREAIKQVERLKSYERDNFELLGCDIDKLEHDMSAAATTAIHLMSGLKIGQGENYGQFDENKSRLFAYQLAEVWRMNIDMPTGQNSAFRNFLEVACAQVGLPVLGRAALDAIIGAGKG
jgi:hypothetical protein